MLKPRHNLGKYRIESRIAEGGFATVYRAADTIEGITVALKIPARQFVNPETMKEFRREVRLTASLDHPNILPIKDASIIDSRFVIAYPLGEGTLTDRLKRRITNAKALSYAEQLLEGLAYAHHRHIIHCDIKPDNLILFPGDRLRITDFGIAKIAQTRTLTAQGTGTLGYVAPEQAMGKPSLRSDVFAVGLVLYRLFAGELPEWPYSWPPTGYDRLKRSLHPELIGIIRRAVEVDEKKRFSDAPTMLAALQRIKARALKGGRRSRKPKKSADQEWKSLRLKAFQRKYGKLLSVKSSCGKCGGPIGEPMQNCPWCGVRRAKYAGPTSFPKKCRRCGRGMKKDWQFCAWCYGPGVDFDDSRDYSDVRYAARCSNKSCDRRDLMPFMRYCPWCRTKVKRPWKMPDTDHKCTRCNWGILKDYWTHCPWCGKHQKP
ncbi:MAG: serine/threonine-protein kinase [Gemmatimonadota bacterium]|nr:serine/threonine-protein kinase [Gemmatimonadota bacterium]MDH5804200.1 serine/threonine-protein kinase [Gemmatimonadota bacterium]